MTSFSGTNAYAAAEGHANNIGGLHRKGKLLILFIVLRLQCEEVDRKPDFTFHTTQEFQVISISTYRTRTRTHDHTRLHVPDHNRPDTILTQVHAGTSEGTYGSGAATRKVILERYIRYRKHQEEGRRYNKD